MRIGAFPRGHKRIQQESAHAFGRATRRFHCDGNRGSLGLRTSDFGRQPFETRLNRYPSPSLRSGPPWARPPLFPHPKLGAEGSDRAGRIINIPAHVSKAFGRWLGLPKGRNTRGGTSCVLDLSLSAVLRRARLRAAATTWPSRLSLGPVPVMPGQRSSGLTRRAVRLSARPATSFTAKKTQASAKPQLTVSPVLTGVLIANRASCSVGFFRLPKATQAGRTYLEGTPNVR